MDPQRSAQDVERDIRQVLVIRQDLAMPKGKAIAQGAHAAVARFTRGDGVEVRSRPDGGRELVIQLDDDLEAWVAGIFKKVCLFVRSEAELLELHDKVQAAGLRCSLIQDNGLTVFKGVPTYTFLSIGPHAKELIDPYTGHLRPY